MNQNQLSDVLTFEDYTSHHSVAQGISEHFRVSMSVGYDAALEFKEKQEMTCEELVHSINKAIVRESLSKLVDQGHAEIVLTEEGEIEYRPIIRKKAHNRPPSPK